MDGEALRIRQAEWDRFHRWEAAQVQVPSGDSLEVAWRWYEETWLLAFEAGSIPQPPQLEADKLRYHAVVRDHLARLHWPT